MAKPYVPTPCRRCGGEKGPPQVRGCKPRYCVPCADEVRREWCRKNISYWCGECLGYGYSCAACAANKRVRLLANAARSKASSKSGYFRPMNAERWWQQRCHSAVAAAVRRGLLPNLKAGEYACVDCGGVALEYDHRDYSRPFDVAPVCRSCNKQRGTATWPTPGQFDFARRQKRAA